VKQIIPGKVWLIVYADYQAAYPHCELDQETMKARERETIEALGLEIRMRNAVRPLFKVNSS
jgi:hypothetical protein